MLQAKHVSWSAGHGAQARPIVRGVSLQVQAGEMVGIVGPNGCGKSSLLRLLYRALRPEPGGEFDLLERGDLGEAAQPRPAQRPDKARPRARQAVKVAGGRRHRLGGCQGGGCRGGCRIGGRRGNERRRVDENRGRSDGNGGRSRRLALTLERQDLGGGAARRRPGGR